MASSNRPHPIEAGHNRRSIGALAGHDEFWGFSKGLQTLDFIGAPEEIRTPDPQIRSLVLYPAELRARPVYEGRVVSSGRVVRKGAGWAAIALILLDIERVPRRCCYGRR